MAFDSNEPKVVCVHPCVRGGKTVITTGEYVEVLDSNEKNMMVMVKGVKDGVIFGWAEHWRFLLVDHPVHDIMLLHCHKA
jgi:hypothetical protein